MCLSLESSSMVNSDLQICIIKTEDQQKIDSSWHNLLVELKKIQTLKLQVCIKVELIV